MDTEEITEVMNEMSDEEIIEIISHGKALLEAREIDRGE